MQLSLSTQNLLSNKVDTGFAQSEASVACIHFLIYKHGKVVKIFFSNYLWKFNYAI